jgi:hypothetical protein
MKLIALLFLLISCNSEPLYKVKECVRVAATTNVVDFYIRDMVGGKYIMSPVYTRRGEVFVTGTKFAFNIKQLDTNNSKKINCNETE